MRERVARLLDPDSLAEEGLLANWEQEGLGADGVVTGMGTVGGPAGGADGERPRGQGRVVGAEDRREDPPDPGAGTQPPGSDRLSGRLRGRPDHRPGADVPRTARGRPHLPHAGPALGPGAAGLPAVRAERGRRRLHPGLLRRRDHARRQRVDVPRLTADGGDGDRREGHPRGDGRCADAHLGLRMRALPQRVRRGRDRPRPPLPLVHARQLAGGPAGGAARRTGREPGGLARSSRRTRRTPSTSRT